MSSFGYNQTIISKEQSPYRTLPLFELRGVCVCVCVCVCVYTHIKMKTLGHSDFQIFKNIFSL